jgi:hypothetical protein
MAKARARITEDRLSEIALDSGFMDLLLNRPHFLGEVGAII